MLYQRVSVEYPIMIVLRDLFPFSIMLFLKIENIKQRCVKKYCLQFLSIYMMIQMEIRV